LTRDRPDLAEKVRAKKLSTNKAAKWVLSEAGVPSMCALLWRYLPDRDR
jgi:hypothetical protein